MGKQVKRAYYQQSLLWHPDRWAALPEAFQDAAQQVFELIAAAYKELAARPTPQGKRATTADDSSFDQDESVVYAV